MRKLIGAFVSGVFVLTSNQAVSEVINAQQHIQKNGYHSVGIGNDGRTKIHTFTEYVNSSRVNRLEFDISALPKNPSVQKVCDAMRGELEIKLSKQQGLAVQVVVTNYGYNESTYACALRYSNGGESFPQLMYYSKGSGGLYTVIVYERKT